MTDAQWYFEQLSPPLLAQTRALILAGLREHWGALDPTLNPDLDEMLVTYAAGHTTVAVDHDDRSRPLGRVIGTGTIVPRPEEDACEILRMSVDRHRRRTGLGRAIVSELEGWAATQGHSKVILETTSAWTDVVFFYLSCGYTITHTAPSEFGEDTWFEKNLAPD